MALSELGHTGAVNLAYTPADPYRRLRINWNDPGMMSFNPRVFGNSTVVPGSVRIIAPDATPGSIGSLTPYTRVPFPLHEPAPNQFAVDVEHNNPDPGVAAVYFHASQTYSWASGTPLPDGSNNVLVYYEVQNNKKGDVLRVNYVTKSVMTVILGVQVYDSTSGRPQVVQLTNKIRLRNVRT